MGMRAHLTLVKNQGGGDNKSEKIEVKPSSSKETGKIDTDTLFDKIGQLFEL